MSKITVEEMSDSLKNHLAQQAETKAVEQVEQLMNEQFTKTENTKYKTVDGYKQFYCEQNGYIDNVYIKGQTFVNIGPMKNINGTDADGIVRTRFKPLNEFSDNFVNYKRYSNGVFTLYNFTNKSIQYVGRNSSDVWNWSTIVAAQSCKVVTMPADQCIVGVDFRPVDGWSNADLSIYNTTMFMVLEGDHSDKHLAYFEGMKSFGEDGEMSILTLSENLFDKNDFRLGSTMSTAGVKFEIDSRTTRITHNNPIPVEMYDFLALDFDRVNFKIFVYELDANDVILQSYHWNTNWYIRAVTPGTKYIRCIFAYHNDREMTMSDYDKIHPYLAMKSEVGHVKATLRSLPNGVCDTIEKHNGKYYKVERIKEIRLDSSNGWTLENTDNSTVQCKSKLYDDIKDFDALIFIDGEDCTKSTPADLGIKVGGGEKRFYYRIAASRLSSANLTGFKTYLNSNPLKLLYETSSVNMIEIPDFNPIVYEGESAVSVRTGTVNISADISFEVTNNMINEIDVLKNKVANIDDQQLNSEVFIYKIDLGENVSATGNNVCQIIKSKDNAILTAELYASTNLAVGAIIGKINNVKIAQGFYPVPIIISNGGTAIGWLYRDGLIKLFTGSIPANITFCFTVPVLLK